MLSISLRNFVARPSLQRGTVNLFLFYNSFSLLREGGPLAVEEIVLTRCLFQSPSRLCRTPSIIMVYASKLRENRFVKFILSLIVDVGCVVLCTCLRAGGPRPYNAGMVACFLVDTPVALYNI